MSIVYIFRHFVFPIFTNKTPKIRRKNAESAPWEARGKPCGNLAGSPWEPRGKPVGTLWEARGKPVGTPWEPCGKPVGSPWEAVRTLWKARGKPVGTPWEPLENHSAVRTCGNPVTTRTRENLWKPRREPVETPLSNPVRTLWKPLW